MKKKVIGPILCFIFIIATVFGTLYAVDHQRMKNNEPVVFSTWGKQYVPPVNDYPIRNGVNPDEEQSFVGTVIEETTSYMVVEPAHDEYEKTVADRIKIEYGTDHIDYLYGTGRMVVIYYKGDINTADGNMASIKSDDISTEGFREWEMKVVPSNEPNNKKIMEKCRKLEEYAIFIGKIRAYRKRHYSIEKAIDMAVDDCIKKGILADILQTNREEVCSMLLTEYDEQAHIENEREIAKEEITPYLDAVNEKAKELAKKYNQKYKAVNFSSFIR